MTLAGVSVQLRRPASQRLTLVIGVTAVLVSVSAFWLAWQTLDDAEDRVKDERLGLVELAAVHADHILTEAFFELEVVAEFAGREPGSEQIAVTNFSAPLLLLDREGAAISIGGSESPRSVIDAQPREIAAILARDEDRSISESFVSSATGHPTVALSVPIFDDRGTHIETVVGFLDVDEHIRRDLGGVAAQFGASAHLDVIDSEGIVIASSEHGTEGDPGHHADFYRRAAAARSLTVELVPHADDSPPHVVAYAPMGGAPWGVALGASEADTFLVPDRRRSQLIAAAIASAVTLVLGMLLISVEVCGRGSGLGASAAASPVGDSGAAPERSGQQRGVPGGGPQQ